MLPDFDRVDRIGSYWGNPKTRTFGELLIDCEEDRTLRAILVGMLREDERSVISNPRPRRGKMAACVGNSRSSRD